VVGNRWSPRSHQVKDFLARNQIPYQWIEYAESNSQQQLPLVLFSDGSRLIQPSNAEIAERIGLKTQAERPFYAFVIVGGDFPGK
jgi:thioredoxin reductase (NADPH)